MPEPDPEQITYTYTDASGTYFARVYRSDVSRFINELLAKDWGNGRFEILRIGGKTWDQTEYKDAVERLHAHRPATSSKHQYVLCNAMDFTVETFDDDQTFVAKAVRGMMWMGMPLSIDGAPVDGLWEAPLLHQIYAEGSQHPTDLDYVVLSNPDKYVQPFLQLIEQLRNNPAALR